MSHWRRYGRRRGLSEAGVESEIGSATTRAAARALVAARLRAVGVEDPDREATLVLRVAARITFADLIARPDERLGFAADEVERFTRRREAREPLSRIEGRRAFWRHELNVTPAVLDPRPETEVLIQQALRIFPHGAELPLKVLDLGVGSGAILCALLAEWPLSIGLGVDISPMAVEVARANAAALGLEKRVEARIGRWGEGLEETFDVVVANPPYIPTAEIAGLDAEVRDYDPHLALDGGPDGLDAYRSIAPDLRRVLAKEGRFFLEIGLGQAPEVSVILESENLCVTALAADFSGVLRVVCGCRKGDPI